MDGQFSAALFRSRSGPVVALLAIACAALTTTWAFCEEVAPAPPAHVRVTWRGEADDLQQLQGRVLVTDQQGGVLLEDAAGVYWSLTADRIVDHTDLAEPFQALTAEQFGKTLQGEAGSPAIVVTTTHYVIASRASRAYTKWCGALFERLRSGFLNYWQRSGLPLDPGQAPLPVIIFADRGQYRDYARRDGAAAVAEGVGYYSARTNRVVLFDLTSELGGRPLGDSASREEIQRRLSGATASIATIVHEATHQLAFNSGLQTRYADNPMWLTEGLAMFFEMPDLRSPSGWQSIGKVNGYRLTTFRTDLPTRPADSLNTLIRDDERFRDPERMLAAYAESWALVHFLASKRRDQLVKYLEVIRRKPRLVFNSPDERVQDLEEALGTDLQALDRELRKHADRLRPAP